MRLPLCLMAMLGIAMGGCTMPWDPAGTLERVRGSVIHVGISHNPPWTDICTAGEPAGKEAEAVRRLAVVLDARVEWHHGGEAELMTQLEQFELDLVIGGLTDDTPWKNRVGLTRPHTKSKEHHYVYAVPPGENGWIVFLDRQLKQMQSEQVAAETDP